MLTESRKKIDDLLEPLARFIEKYSGWLVTFFLLLMLLSAIGIAAHKLFWYDEVVTILTANLPSVGSIWRFFADGIDTTGPVSALLARAGSQLPLPAEISVRMPFIVAFLCSCMGIYIFLRRRYPAGYALAGLLFSLTIPSLFLCMTEARSYALMLAGVSLGMVFWQSAAEGRARALVIPALFLALSVAITAHLFAVFLFVPFAAAQFYLDRTRKRIDWPVWIALLLFPASYLPLLQGTSRAANLYRAGFHAKPSLVSMRIPYRDIYNSGGWVTVSIIGLVALWLLLSESNTADDSQQQSLANSGLTKAEWVLSGTLALYPVYVVIAAFKIGVFRPQYAICFYVGFIIVCVAAFAELARRRAVAGVLILAAVFASVAVIHAGKVANGIKALAHPSRVHPDDAAIVMARPWVQGVAGQQLPFAADPNDYMQFSYYGSPELQGRMIELIDEPEFSDPKISKAVTNEQNFKYFSRVLPLHVMDVQDFLAKNPHFLVVTGFSNGEWLPDYLFRHEAQGELSVKILSYSDDVYLLEVEKK